MALLAGAARVDITPKSPSFLAGYAGRDRPHEGVHDPIRLRAVYVCGDEDAVVVSADILWFADDSTVRIREALQRELGVDPANVFLVGTHTHSAPAVSNRQAHQPPNADWLNTAECQTVAAAALAKNRLREVSVSVARGSCAIGINRREQKPDGTVVLGNNPDGPIDRELILAALTGDDGVRVATICNFACHGVVLGPRNYRLSGDWPGIAAAALEKDGGPFLFINGGAGNVNPRVAPQDSFEPVHELAEEFCGSVQAALSELTPAESDERVRGANRSLDMPRKQSAIDDGMGNTRSIGIDGIRIGPIRLLGFPGEIFSQTTVAVKAEHAGDVVMVASYACGSTGGYVPVREAYETGGYEVKSSPYAESGESVLRQGLAGLVREL